MASTVEPLLKLEQMADGENENTWGAKTNTNLALIANAIAKRQSLTLAGSNISLSDTQFADSQARSLALDLGGTLSANVAITIPGRSKMYIVRNGAAGSFDVTIGASGGTYATLPRSATAIVWCDGTNTAVIASNQSAGPVDATTLGGSPASAFAKLALNQSWTAGQAVTFVQVTDAATLIVDCALSNKFYCILAGNRTVALSNQKDGQEIELQLIQDGTGGRTFTWPASVAFPAGEPVALDGPNEINAFKLTYNNALTKWIGESASIDLEDLALTGVPTAPTAAVGTSTTQIATTAFANPGQNLAPDGHVTLPGGAILNWGTGTATGNGDTAVVYDQAYATLGRPVVSGADGLGDQDNGPAVLVSSLSTTGFTVRNGVATSIAFTWIAIGY